MTTFGRMFYLLCPAGDFKLTDQRTGIRLQYTAVSYLIDKIPTESPRHKMVNWYVDDPHIMALTWIGKSMRYRCPKQANRSAFNHNRTAVNDVLHIIPKGNIHLNLTMPVIARHGVRRSEFDIDFLIGRIERKRTYRHGLG
ncbi:hypothetical protein VCR6J2_230405 [Vibrio coralliirubri]|nr:hypothetical protein VCR6J2_230405 [Vibrio coralliirubri]